LSQIESEKKTYGLAFFFGLCSGSSIGRNNRCSRGLRLDSRGSSVNSLIKRNNDKDEVYGRKKKRTGTGAGASSTLEASVSTAGTRVVSTGLTSTTGTATGAASVGDIITECNVS